jgi:hypothetical protein
MQISTVYKFSSLFSDSRQFPRVESRLTRTEVEGGTCPQASQSQAGTVVIQNKNPSIPIKNIALDFRGI